MILPSGCSEIQVTVSRSFLWLDMLCDSKEGVRNSVLMGILKLIRSSTSPEELMKFTFLRNSFPSVFVLNDDAVEKIVGVLIECRAKSSENSFVSLITLFHVVLDTFTLFVSACNGSNTCWIVLFTSHRSFDTILAPVSDAILVLWATSWT